MLTLFGFKELLFWASMLILLVVCFSENAAGDEMPLVVDRAKVIESLDEARSQGITIHIEQYGQGDTFGTLRVCKMRESLPDDVSAVILVGLEERYESKKNRLLVGFTQQMLIDESNPGYDIGRFQIRTERLAYLSLLFSHAYRDSGLDWQGESSAISLRFRDFIDDLISEDRTSYSNFQDFLCHLPSGRYIYRP